MKIRQVLLLSRSNGSRMSTSPSDTLGIGHLANKDLVILPTGGHQIPAILSFNHYCIGYLDEKLDSLPNEQVFLGTTVTESQSSRVGFRLLVRSNVTATQAKGAFDRLYHTISFRMRPEKGRVCHRPANVEEQEFFRTNPGVSISLEALHCLEFSRLAKDVSCDVPDHPLFQESHHGESIAPALMPQVTEQILNMNDRNITRFLVFFEAHDMLLTHLNRTIERGSPGVADHLRWDPMPVTAVHVWPANNQTGMVAGSTDIVNVLSQASHDPLLNDTPVTRLSMRPKAQRFKACIQAALPRLRIEPNNKVFPIMLDVKVGICIDLPFGGSMYNRANSFAGIDALNMMIYAGLSPADIVIVTFYPSQAEKYQKILTSYHKRSPEQGYEQVKVGMFEDVVGKEVEFAIVDFVQTSNTTGNLGFLSHTRLLQFALTLHRNGLVLVGSRSCTVNSQDVVICTELEKIFKWLEENGRIVPVGHQGVPNAAMRGRNRGKSGLLPRAMSRLSPIHEAYEEE